jgi:pimeloyl-ACP methyl ester carboxylesterase
VTARALVAAVLAIATACSTEAGRPTPSPIPSTSSDRLGVAGQSSDFYELTEPLPPGEPGAIIRTEETSAPSGTRAWRVIYHSRALGGADIAVSGVVVAPTGAPPPGGFPVLSWAHGTTGLADSCAPSRFGLGAALYWDILPELAARGYVVAATDYEGLGTPGLHPYIVGASEGRGVLDAVRAARRIPEAGAGNRAVVLGHSQGGHAALFAGEIAPRYAPDVDVIGVVAAAPPAELDSLGDQLEGSPFIGYSVAVLAAYSAVYPEARLEEVLTARALADIGVLEEGCVGDILSTYDRPPGQLFRGNRLERPPWPALFARNSPGRTSTPDPVLIVQGTDDEQIPVEVVRALSQRLCTLGVTADLQVYRHADHGGVLSESRADVIDWIEDRFAGRPAVDGCPTGENL